MAYSYIDTLAFSFSFERLIFFSREDWFLIFYENYISLSNERVMKGMFYML